MLEVVVVYGLVCFLVFENGVVDYVLYYGDEC